MRVLGAVLAGGRSSRFGSDKALALHDGLPLIRHAIDALASQCEAVVVVGRDYPGVTSIPDWPVPDCGPLGGLAGVFRHALETGNDYVLTCGVDSYGLPSDLLERLSPAPGFAASQPVLGLWPAAAAGTLEQMFNEDRLSVFAFAERIGARPVKLAIEPANVNTPDDLARLEQPHGV